MTWYITCENCGQLCRSTDYVCSSCHKEWYLDYSKCKHDDINELEIHITNSCVPNHTFTEAFCYHCCSEVELSCHAKFGMEDIATFERPDGTKLLIPYKTKETCY